MESQVTTVERNTDDMNNFSQENPFLLLSSNFSLTVHTNITYLIAAANISTVTTMKTLLQSAMQLIEI